MNQINIDNLTGNILRIERSSIHDGQGLRSVVFLKGCPLTCPWCSTPESQNALPEKGYDSRLCTACQRCLQECPEQAISPSGDGLSVITDRSICKNCFHCYAVCPSKAVKKYGYQATVSELVAEISKDEIFYYHSKGGVTISGGEPLCQADFAAAVLKNCKELGIHTALESCLYGEYENLEKVLPWLDHLYADLKHMDDSMHTLWVGAGNHLILENLKRADQSIYPFSLVLRIPLIPGFNDTHENLDASLDFALKLKKIKTIELLPYHRLGSDTYRLLGQPYRCADLKPPENHHLQQLASYLAERSEGIPIKVGSGLI